jgi:alkaline phosphatase
LSILGILIQSGHGFDVTGSVDTKYLNEADSPRKKRNAVGVYQNSGLSQYVNSGNLTYGTGHHFPANWDPRYTLQQGVVTFPDHREDYQVNKDGPRLPAIAGDDAKDDYVLNTEDSPSGFLVNGTLNLPEAQGVHSLTDVPVFAMGPCSEIFGGVYNNVDIFYKMAECLGLSEK